MRKKMVILFLETVVVILPFAWCGGLAWGVFEANTDGNYFGSLLVLLVALILTIFVFVSLGVASATRYRLWEFWLRQGSFIVMRRDVLDALRSGGSDHTDKPLLMALVSHDADVRQAAAEGLEKRGDRQAVEALIGATQHEDASVRRTAAQALQRIGDERSLSHLASLLHNADVETRLVAIRALEQMRGTASVEQLIAALQDENFQVRWAAAEALGHLGDVRAIGPLVERLTDTDGAAWALGQLGDVRAVGPLMVALQAHRARGMKNPGLNCIHALGQLGDIRAVGFLVEILVDKDPDMRRFAAVALSKIAADWPELEATKSAIPALVAALASPDGRIRETATETLGRIGAKETVDPLILALTDTDMHVRWAAVQALGRIGAREAIYSLVLTCSDNYTGVRETAEKSLQRIDANWTQLEAAQSAIPVLLERLRTENWPVCEGAAITLKALGWQPVEARDYARMGVVLEPGNDLPALGDAAVEEMITWLMVQIEYASSNVVLGALEKVLKSYAVRLPEELLRRLAVLQDVTASEGDLYHETITTVGDASKVRAKARQELRRRRGGVLSLLGNIKQGRGPRRKADVPD